jgi:hypothetical protein
MRRMNARSSEGVWSRGTRHPRLPIGQPRWRQPVTGVGLLNQDCLKVRRAIAHLTLALGFVVGFSHAA